MLFLKYFKLNNQILNQNNMPKKTNTTIHISSDTNKNKPDLASASQQT